MPPHNLSTPNQQTARLRSTVVVPTPDAPVKAGRGPTDRPAILSERLARDSGEYREDNDSDRRHEQDRMARDRGRPKKRTHRRARSSSSGESEQSDHRKCQRGTVRLHGIHRGHRELNLEERGQKLTVSQNFNATGEPEGDRDILIQSLPGKFKITVDRWTL